MTQLTQAMKSVIRFDITIIITCHNKNKIVYDAMHSALNQSFPRNRYEVILVSDFKDKSLIDYCKLNGIHFHFTEAKAIGPKIALGVEKALGDTLCMLNDDDMFSEDKLDFIYTEFKQNRNLVYIHNNQNFIDHKGNETTGRGTKLRHRIEVSLANYTIGKHNFFAKNNLFFNDSSVSIKKCVIMPYLTALEQIRGLQDNFMFYFALLSDYQLLFVPDKVTYFRVHSGSASSIFTGGQKKYCDIVDRRLSSLSNVKTIVKLEKSVTVKDLMEGDLYSILMQHIIMGCSEFDTNSIRRYSNEIDFNQLVKIGYFNKMSRILLFCVYLFHKNFPFFSRRILYIYYKIF